MKRSCAFALAGALGLAGCGDSAVAPAGPAAPSLDPAFAVAGTARVSSSADAGPGSFREAIDQANGDPSITRVQFQPGVGVIALTAPVTYSGPQPLTIQGGAAELDASGLAPGTLAALTTTGSSNLSIRDLTISASPGTGLTVRVPVDATGTFTVELDRFIARHNGLHGVLINDQADYFDDPASASPEGSPASLAVRVSASRFEENGFALADQDGLRVNEGGPGDLEASVHGTTFAGNGADGLELDERADGDASFTIQQTAFTENGSKVNDPLDFDDGLDVDESGDGSLIGRLVQVTANDNFEEGLDLNENDAGNLEVTMTQVEANGNPEEGVDLEEDDDFAGGGDLVAELRNVTTLGNGSAGGDAGLKLRERGLGSILARIVNPTSSGNAISGIQLREQEDGAIAADIVSATASGNGNDGLDLRGEGQVRVQSLTAEGNADQRISISGTVTVIETPAAP